MKINKRTMLVLLIISLLSTMMTPVFAQKEAVTIEATADSSLYFKWEGELHRTTAPPLIIKGRTYIPIRDVSEIMGINVNYRSNAGIIELASEETHELGVLKYTIDRLEKEIDRLQKELEGYKKKVTASVKIIDQSELPYKIKTGNKMSLQINSYSITNQQVQMNVTLYNESTSDHKGMVMNHMFELGASEQVIPFNEQDSIFWDTHYIRANQKITGNIMFEALPEETKDFTLIGELWQYTENDGFSIRLQNE